MDKSKLITCPVTIVKANFSIWPHPKVKASHDYKSSIIELYNGDNLLETIPVEKYWLLSMICEKHAEQIKDRTFYMPDRKEIKATYKARKCTFSVYGAAYSLSAYKLELIIETKDMEGKLMERIHCDGKSKSLRWTTLENWLKNLQLALAESLTKTTELPKPFDMRRNKEQLGPFYG